MAHIKLPEGFPGIRGPMMFRPETAKPLNELVDVLLRGPHTLSPADRELIATYVSARNDCTYCQTIHGAIAAHHLGGDEALVERVKLDFEHAEISEKLRALLAIAGKVQLGGKNVTSGGRRSRAGAGCDGSGNSRHGLDCGSLLLMQSLRRRAGYVGAGRPGVLPATGSNRCHKWICRSHSDAWPN